MAKTELELKQIYDEVRDVFMKHKLTIDHVFYILVLALLQSAALRDEMEGVVRNFMYKNMR